MRTVLFSTYELGRQSFGLASAAAWLRREGADVEVHDLSVCAFDNEMVKGAGFVGVFVPMHTATRLAESLLARVEEEAPDAHIACFGLYAPMNADRLRGLGATTVLGGEFERDLTAAWRVVAGVGSSPTAPAPPSARFLEPDRDDLPDLDRYARLQIDSDRTRITGYTEATRGCKHMCRHCPVVPVYQGRFVVVEPDVVLADVRAQVAAGAEHVTFGDPDFLNGPVHAMRLVRRLHDEFPDLTYDVTIKVEHLANHLDLLPEIQETGCVLVTSAVESFDPEILRRFDKGHSAAEFETVLKEMRGLGLALNPTFVALTPWTTPDGYMALLSQIGRLGLIGNVAPIQYGIRLLIPAGSRLLELPEVAQLVEPFDDVALAHPWHHPDPRMDRLAETILKIVRGDGDRNHLFGKVWVEAAKVAGGDWPSQPPFDEEVAVVTVPYLTEPWYC